VTAEGEDDMSASLYDSDVPDEDRSFNRLVHRLGGQPFITRRDAPGEPPEAEALGLALVDIRRSCKSALASWFPILFDPASTDEEFLDALAELREELRHILYHVEDARYLRLLLPPE